MFKLCIQIIAMKGLPLAWVCIYRYNFCLYACDDGEILLYVGNGHY